jgi:hypothetical protein
MWDWLDGRKTIIGTLVLIAAAFVDQVVIAIWYAPDPGGPLVVVPHWIPKLGRSLDWVGMAVAGVGLTHKGVKIAQGTNTTGTAP